MRAMLEKYEVMKNKLDSTKKHLETTNTKILEKEQLTDKIQGVKDRIEAYASKKEAVTYLNQAVKIKYDDHQTKLEAVREAQEEEDEKNKVAEALQDKNTERVERLKVMMEER